MSGILAPHPWDKLGPPPPIGRPYIVEPVPAEDAEPFVDDATEAARLLRLADDKREEAEECERDADRYESEAAPFLAKLPPALRDAIEDDPHAIDNADDVAKAMAS